MGVKLQPCIFQIYRCLKTARTSTPVGGFFSRHFGFTHGGTNLKIRPTFSLATPHSVLLWSYTRKTYGLNPPKLGWAGLACVAIVS
jgi:hypothetical protein